MKGLKSKIKIYITMALFIISMLGTMASFTGCTSSSSSEDRPWEELGVSKKEYEETRNLIEKYGK